MIFFGQRDKRWSSVNLGPSKRTVGTDGCTTCTISDSASFLLNSVKDPGYLARTLNYTKEGYILWDSMSKIGLGLKNRSRFYNKQAILDGLKNPKTTVSLNVDGGRHWVFALKALPFNQYWVHDPWTNSKKVYGGVVGSATIIRL